MLRCKGNAKWEEKKYHNQIHDQFFSIHVCVIGLSLKITIFGVWGKNIDIWFDLGIWSLPTKDIKFGVLAQALCLMQKGVEELAGAVKFTTGPKVYSMATIWHHSLIHISDHSLIMSQ